MVKYLLGLSTATILLTAPISAYSQSLWQDSETGMSLNQVKQKFPDAVEPSKVDEFGSGKKALLEIPNYKIGTNTFKVQFLFKDSELSSVRMVMTEGIAKLGFSNMKKLLKTKYGEPFDSNSNDLSYSMSWVDNGTTINLTNFMNKLVINYKADEVNEANKL